MNNKMNNALLEYDLLIYLLLSANNDMHKYKFIAQGNMTHLWTIDCL